MDLNKKLNWLLSIILTVMVASILCLVMPVRADDDDATPTTQSYSTLNSLAINMETTADYQPLWYGNYSVFCDEDVYPGLIIVEDSLFSTGGATTLGIDGTALSGVADEKVGVSGDDTTPDYLGVKLTGGDGLTATILNPAGNEVVDIDVNVKAGVMEIDGDDVDIADDGVGDQHVDFGTGANQVESSDVPNDTTNFNGNLGAGDSDVLAALETLDELPIGGGIREYFLETTASDIGGYKEMAPTYAADAARNSSAAIIADGTAIEEWATDPTEPNLTFLESGVYDMHLHAEQTGGTKTSTIYFELYKRASGGGETLLGTSHETDNLTGVDAEYSVHVYITEQAILATDRIVIKLLGNEGGAGTDPVVQVNYQAATLTRFEFPAQATVSSAVLIDQGGGTGGTYGALTGLINGANQSYDTSRAFTSTNLRVFLNGVFQIPDGDDYTVTDSDTFSMTVAPPTGSILLAVY